MSILDIKNIECVYSDFDLDAIYEEQTEMIETLAVDTSKTKIENSKLYLTTLCGKEFEFRKSDCENWSRARGNLINSDIDGIKPERVSISLF